ncbi:hypothetical protein DFH07DRAFT_952214 [Mycena maculata]|uniref:DUF6589 domain-containing protein n=1 Tax=Mycena maculata TaxID=230809 RepID=A0AAD7JYA5_9AGAR|nr:hypothetical protein DFH07DRAFT_952214 [Mycena maculata]
MDSLNPIHFYSPPAPRPAQSRAQNSVDIPSTPAVSSTPAGPIISSTTDSPTPVTSTQKALRGPKRTKWQKVDSVVSVITKEFHKFGGLGGFLELLFHVRDFSINDPRTPGHKRMVTAFLDGESKIGITDIIDLIYQHPAGRPAKANAQSALYFSPPDVAKPKGIKIACPALSTWALQLVGPEMRKQIGDLTQNDPDDLEDITQLRASTNGWAKHVCLATWNDLRRVSIPWMADSEQVQVGVISSLTLSRNQYASGYLALPLAIWQFATEAHVDEKRIMSRFGFSVHDSTARACLDSLTDLSLTELKQSIAEGIATSTMRWQLVLDNVQQYCRQHDHRIGREDALKIGTAATAILLEDCAPGAFDLQDHLDWVMHRERKDLTTDALLGDIDWPYIQELMTLHWVLILVMFIPQLAHLRKEVSALFRSDKMTKLCLRWRISVMQALGTNSEWETETQGMMRVILDFCKQMGLDKKALENLIFMAFRNLVPPGPKVWHTRWTQLNALATNYYDSVASADPSSLSKSASAAGAKRPANLKKVDFFPTSRSMQLFFEARVLDCWRILFKADDIIKYFEKPQTNLPGTQSL